MYYHLGLGIGVVLCLQLYFSDQAKAQITQASENSDIVSQALSEYQAGRYPEALSLFERAYAINPSAHNLRGMGLSAFKSGDYVNAIKYLEQALQETREPLNEQLRQHAKKTISKATNFVSRYRVVLIPKDLQLSVDGNTAQVVEGKLLLNPGEHDVLAKADNHRELRLHLKARSGKESELNIELEPISTPEETVELAPTTQLNSDDDPSEEESDISLTPYIVLSAGGAILLGSLVTGILTEMARNDLDEKCTAEAVCTPDLEPTKERGEILSLTTNILIATGSAVTATGLLLLLFMNDVEEKHSVETASFGCGPTGCFGRLNGTF